MNVKFFILLLAIGSGLHAQTALQNTGNLRIHENGQMGFHTDLVNDGLFDENQGLVGFYGDSIRTISGALITSFFDAECITSDGVVLNTTVNISNNTNFISGNLITPRNEPATTLNYLATAFSTGENDVSKVDGYASMTGQQNFTFPVGDSEQLRPLILNSAAVNTVSKCAYFFEDPNAPTTFDTAFNTSVLPDGISAISIMEFWRLEGAQPSTVQLSWNERSDMGSLTEDISEIVILGWNKASNAWENLEGPASVGDVNQGVAVSGSFIPDDYAAITFAAAGIPREFLDLEDYLVSPNGDGINDSFEITELAQYPDNHMQIYDRNGSKVFDPKIIWLSLAIKAYLLGFIFILSL
ncbi:hypothetical protein LCGC14_0822740 [marine sediment metagenome]|uniref:Uncharacterized protein n=1 Tax=marine sediment metagenome TaxID=412755 RepID=A0A0F9Q3I9_9ZZZZ